MSTGNEQKLAVKILNVINSGKSELTFGQAIGVLEIVKHTMLNNLMNASSELDKQHEH